MTKMSKNGKNCDWYQDAAEDESLVLDMLRRDCLLGIKWRCQETAEYMRMKSGGGVRARDIHVGFISR